MLSRAKNRSLRAKEQRYELEKIFSLLNDAKMALDGDENYGGGLESVDSASTAFKSVII